jgi:hypothetical protein
MTDWVEDEIQITSGLAVPCFKGKMPTNELNFYVQNPRIHSQVWQDEDEPDQETIYTTLKKQSHVSELKDGIKRTGGTRDEVIVLATTLEVIEGNRRLAVYKWLAESDPVKWGKIPVKVIREDLDDATISSLLSAYHLNDKSLNWSPFERAGMLYRRNYDFNVEENILVKETGLTLRTIRREIKTYKFMQQNKLKDNQFYSHCDQFVHNPGIRNLREEFPEEIQEYFVTGLQQGMLPKATELRDKLGKISKASPNTRKKFAEKKIDLDEAHERMLESGGNNAFFGKVKKFNDWYLDSARSSDVKNTVNPAIMKKMKFVVNKLDKQTQKLKRELGMVDKK